MDAGGRWELGRREDLHACPALAGTVDYCWEGTESSNKVVSSSSHSGCHTGAGIQPHTHDGQCVNLLSLRNFNCDLGRTLLLPRSVLLDGQERATKVLQLKQALSAHLSSRWAGRHACKTACKLNERAIEPQQPAPPPTFKWGSLPPDEASVTRA